MSQGGKGLYYDARTRMYILSDGAKVPREYVRADDKLFLVNEHRINEGIIDSARIASRNASTSRGSPRGNCVNCGAPVDATVCSYCGTKH